MTIHTLIKPSEYYDSVALMLAARELARMPGIEDAAVVMATEANKGVLRSAGLLSVEAENATSNDLVIAVRAAAEAGAQALAGAERMLRKKQDQAVSSEYRPKTLRSAGKANPSANVAVISVAGRYAAAEAWEALHQGLHVLLFSDNVSLEDEIALKRYAVDHGLLLMGPGAGTAILNGAALGFANVLPRGPVGIVSAAGTGLQEVSTLLARRGVGITQGIGTGGRDLKEAVGGLMMLAGLQALQDDAQTEVIVLVSKPPSRQVARKVLDQVERSPKPVIACFIGWGEAEMVGAPHRMAGTLEEAAEMAAGLVADFPPELSWPQAEVPALRLHGEARTSPRWLRALFSGGTLCYEAQAIWRQLLSEPVYSNAPLDPALLLPDSTRSQGHSAIDLGEEEFTVGRPHPMIDNDLRIRRLLEEARDPQTGLVVLDVVLGYGAHPDPAAELGPAVQRARDWAAQEGRLLPVIASVTGTEQDPQCYSRQARALEAAGVTVCPSNAAAARLAARWIHAPGGPEGGSHEHR